MKKKLQQLSVNTYTLFLLGFILLFFLALIGFQNHSAVSLLSEHIYRNTQDTVALYQEQIDYELDRIETYLYTVAFENTNYTNLSYQDSSSTSWHSALHYLDQDFQSALSLYTANGFMFYDPEKDSFLFTRQINTSTLTLQKTIREAISADQLPSDWEIREIDGAFYLLRMIGSGKSRLGALISVPSLLTSVISAPSEDVGLFLTTEENCLIGPDNTSLPLDFDILTDSYAIKRINGQKMLVVQQALSNNGFYLTRLIPYSEIQALNISLRHATFLTIILFLAVGLALTLAVNRHLIQPVNLLTGALEKMSEGSLENQILVSGQLREYQQMSDSFNDMVTEIRNLKIDIYEEKLQRQELEIQYLKQQITPHFMINCLNTAYQLIEPEYLNLARSMLMDLSQHLRYTLSAGQTVPLGDDLRMVKNYIEMSGIRYPNCLALHTNCPDAFEQATIVPLLLLNFTENTIKHEVVMGKLLEIHIDVTSYETDDCIRLHVCIWDTGKGFSQQMLALITAPAYPSENDTAHIGITNVIFRMRHIFPDVRFTFCNRPGAGAQIDIDFPYQLLDNRQYQQNKNFTPPHSIQKGNSHEFTDRR